MALAVNQGPVSTPTPENAVVLLIDHQRGLAEWVRDQSPVEFKTAVMGLARTPKTLGIPVIITTSRDFGPNGMLLPEHTGAGRSARICLPRWGMPRRSSGPTPSLPYRCTGRSSGS
jgi:nicotinamidase-related amidase